MAGGEKREAGRIYIALGVLVAALSAVPGGVFWSTLACCLVFYRGLSRRGTGPRHFRAALALTAGQFFGGFLLLVRLVTSLELWDSSLLSGQGWQVVLAFTWLTVGVGLLLLRPGWSSASLLALHQGFRLKAMVQLWTYGDLSTSLTVATLGFATLHAAALLALVAGYVALRGDVDFKQTRAERMLHWPALAAVLVGPWVIWPNFDPASFCGSETSSEATRGCLIELAQRTGDVEPCVALHSPEDIVVCVTEAIALPRHDDAACHELKDLDPKAEKRCVERVSEASLDPRECLKHNSEYRINCLDRAARHVGPDACWLLAAGQRQSCLAALSGVIEDWAAACEGSTACQLAMARYDFSLCEALPTAGEPNRMSCLKNAAREGAVHLSQAKCESLHDIGLRDDCLNIVAERPGRGGTCLAIADPVRRRRCVNTAAKDDIALCSELREREDVTDCLRGYIFATPDTEVCAAIEPSFRAECEAATKKTLAARLEKLK